MAGTYRIRISERDSIEGGLQCPKCGGYTSFADIVATGGCSHGEWRGGDCDVELALDLVVSNA